MGVARDINERAFAARIHEYLLQPDVTETGVRDVANEDPPDLEDTLPLVRSPDCAAPSIVDLARRSRVSYKCRSLVDIADIPA